MKIFAIGFNKCGTTSLDRFFKAGGLTVADNAYRSQGKAVNLAGRMFKNKEEGADILDGIDGADFYTDLELNKGSANLQANSLFPELEQAYPDAKFILNIRDKDNWIRSREHHNAGRYLQKQMRARKLDDAEAVKKSWADEWDAHIAKVREYFADKPEKLIEFNIETDDPQKLVDFFGDIPLDKKAWKKHRGNRRLNAKLEAREAAVEPEEEAVG